MCNESSSAVPRVIACGHRQIQSTKSPQITFPAWLIAFPAYNAASNNNNNNNNNNNKSTSNDKQYHINGESILSKNNNGSSSYSLRWRSNKDLLLISRAIAMASLTPFANTNLESPSYKDSNKRSIVYPKKAIKKLSDRAARHPWVRPNNAQNIHPPLARETCKAVGLEATSFDFTLPDTMHNNNGYTKNMKKSLLQIDQYFDSAVALLFLLKKSGVILFAKDKVNITDLERAWNIFCRDEDTDNLVVPCDCVAQEKNTNESSSAVDYSIMSSLERASSLGQYFANATTVNQVVNEALQIAMHKFNLKNCVFIEPSCGDGRILQQLQQSYHDIVHLGNNCNDCPALFIGYDIDLHVVQQCRQRQNACSSCSIPFICRDFLEVTREDVFVDLREHQSFPNHAKKANSSSVASLSAKSNFIVLGGPPYTRKNFGGRHHDRSSIDREVPTKFLQHCLISLQAKTVVFILPYRYQRSATNMTTFFSNAEDKSDEIVKRKHIVYDELWFRVSTELSDNTFEFEGTIVKQPSTIQSWVLKK